MIAWCGTRVAHLGGPYGDRLTLSVDAGPFRLLADLGIDRAAQCTPQRRLRVTPDAVWVLEPRSGAFLAPPFRVRRFADDGAEGAPREDEAEGPGDLIFQCYPGGRFVHGGIELESGRPLRWERELPDKGRAWGSVQRLDGVWWYQVRGAGILNDAGGFWPCEPGPIQVIGGQVVCVGTGGVFRDGEVVSRDAAAFPPYGLPLTALAAAAPDGSLVVLMGPAGPVPGRVPPGVYSALVTLGETVFAVEESAGPRLVPVEL